MVKYNIHDFIFFKESKDLEYEGILPTWVKQKVARYPVAVVRRDVITDKIAIGIRGDTKAQKFAAYITPDKITKYLSSVDVLKLVKNHNSNVDLWKAISEIRSYLDKKNLNWGLSGSAAYELVTGIPTVTKNSDIDLIAFKQEKLSQVEAKSLLAYLNSFGLHADVQIMRGSAGFSLEEYAKSKNNEVLIKSNKGPYLSRTPWEEFE